MNPFDAAVCLCLIVAEVMGFRSGLLRSVATILGYLAAAPIALVLAPRAAPLFGVAFDMQKPASWMVLFGAFFATGLLISMGFRAAVRVTVGEEIGAADRVAGAGLGAIRIFLLAVLMVLIFDRIIPPQRQPAFLVDSRLRPLLSIAGQQGVRTLPPEIVAQIDKLKRERGI